MEKEYFTRALTRFDLPTSFNLVLIKYGIKNGYLHYDNDSDKFIDSLSRFDPYLYHSVFDTNILVSSHDFNRVYIDEFDSNFNYDILASPLTTRALGEFLGNICPFNELPMENNLSITFNIKHGHDCEGFSMEIINMDVVDIKYRILRRLDRYQEFAKKLYCEVTMDVEDFIVDSMILSFIEKKELEYFKEYSYGIFNLISSTSLNKTAKYIEDYLNSLNIEDYEEYMIDSISALASYYKNISSDKRDTEGTIKTKEKYDLRILKALKKKKYKKVKSFLDRLYKRV